jgi:hypothetical protein
MATPSENSLFLHVYPSLTKNEGSAPIFSFLTTPLIAEIKKEGIGMTSYFLEVLPIIAIAEIGDLFSRALYPLNPSLYGRLKYFISWLAPSICLARMKLT